jgi:hypothetical protein
MYVFVFDIWKSLIIRSQFEFLSYLWVSHATGRFLVPLIDQCRREGSIHREDSEVDPFEISDTLNIRSYSYPNRHLWSFAFAHASTSSKCILFSMQCLFQLNSFVEWPEQVECIVSEMIDWLKVRDPALIKEIFCNPDHDLGRTKQRILDRRIS